MDEWKIRQMLYRKFVTKTDHIEYPILADAYSDQQLIDGMIAQFKDSSNTIHPYKSYCVALVYAHNLARMYGGSQIMYLSDPELLPEDPCFVPYEKAKLVYNYFIGENWWQGSEMGNLIRQYWHEEYCSDIEYA